MARRGRKKKPERASVAYTVSTIILLAGIAFLAVGLHGLHWPGTSREGTSTVLVLNGCGVEGVGRRAARFLRERGYDVVDFRNADRFSYDRTIVVDRTGDMESAAALGLELGTSSVIQQIQETPLEDLVIVIGDDYERFLQDVEGD